MTNEEYKNFIKAEYDKLFNTDKEYLRIKDIKKMHNISQQQLHYWVKQGYVRTIAAGKQFKYNIEDIEKMI